MFNKKENIIKINEQNTIESIIEFYQQFSEHYDIQITKLDSNIQYQIKNIKITQTYMTTLDKINPNKVIKQLNQQKEKIIILIIKNNKKTNFKTLKIIKEMEKIENITTKIIKENETLKTINKLMDSI